MSSIDHRDAQVQNHFNSMKKAVQDYNKFRIAQQLAKMYEKNDDYTYGIFSRTYKFISQSNDRQQKKNGLIVLTKLGQRMQGVARSVFVNKFHSPVFKLFENNQQQSLIEYLQQAYQVILQVGGNRNDSVVESNLNTSLQILANNVKDVKKMSVYSILKVLVIESPYITFKKILQKQKTRNEDNLSLITSTARSKNIKVRKAYLKFINEYIQYIAEKKDQTFQKLTYQRLIDNSFNVNVKEYRQNNEEYLHLFLQTLGCFLRHLPSAISRQSIQVINKIIVEKIAANKSIFLLQKQIIDLTIQKSLITIIPLAISKGIQQASVSVCLSYLREIKGQEQIIAQNAINMILESYHKNKEDYIQVYKSILAEIALSLRNNIQNHEKNHQFYHNIASAQIKTIHILIKCHTSMNYGQLISKDSLNQLASYALLIRLDEQTLKLVHQISRENIHDLGQLIEKKMILVMAKILTGTTKKIMRQAPQELKQFVQLLDKLYRDTAKDVDQNKIKAIEALSRYRFREQFRDVIGSFVKDKVLKYYLQWGNAAMRNASVQAAFFLCVKKGNLLAANQMLQILQKLVRVGVTDTQQLVRQNVFSSILNNLFKHDDFYLFFGNLQILNCLFQLTQDKNERIRLSCLKIICILHNRNTSPMITPFLKKIAYNCFYHFSSNFKFYHQKTYWIKSFSILIQNAAFVIRSHVNTLLELLLKYLQDRVNYEGLEIIFFQMFKILTQSLPDSVIPFVQRVSGYLIQAMKDKLNSKKRTLALRTFVSIIKNCGYVIIPYFNLQNLQQTLIYLLRSEIDYQSRNDLMRIIGGLGVVDNYQMKDEMRRNNFIENNNNNQSPINRTIQATTFWQRKLMIQKRNEQNKCQQQLREYYDELLLLHSSTNRSKGLMMMVSSTNKEMVSYKNSNNFNSNRNHSLLTQSSSTSSFQHYPKLSKLLKPLTKPSKQQIQFINESMVNFNMVILKNLFDILCDLSLGEKHQLTIDILSQVLEMMGDQVQSQLDKVIPFLLTLSQTNTNILQLVIIVSQKCDIEMFINQTLQCALREVNNLELTLSLLDTLTSKYPHALRHHLQSIIDRLYQIVQENLNNNTVVIKIIRIYMNMKSLLQPYLGTIVPQMLDKFLITHSEISNYLIEFFMLMSKYCPSLIQFVPQIINCFCMLLMSCHNRHFSCKPCLRTKICNCVVTFIIEFGNQFLVHLPLIHRAIVRCQQTHELYNKAIRKIDCCNLGNIKSQFTYEQLEKLNVQYKSIFSSKVDYPKYVRKVDGTQQLIHQFDPMGKKLVDTDWIEWLKKTAIFLLKKSPNIILRACSDLAEEYTQLALQLYNISFYYFWEILLDQQKKNLIDNLKKILLSNPKPFLLVRKTILNLAEFMNRKKCSFEINSSLLADSARDSSAYAKHLYYRQLQFEVIPQKTIQKLIDVSMKLGEPQNAFGLFKVAQNLGIKCKVDWYQRIQRYEQAYLLYEKSNQSQYKINKLKCLSHIDEQRFVQQLNEQLVKGSQQIAQLAANSYANLQQWNLVEQYTQHLPQQVQSRSFWQSIIHVKKQNYPKALNSITKTRKLIYEEISQLVNFTSSGQPTQKLLKLQQLFQLQELINVKLMKNKMLELIQKFPEQQQTQKFKLFYQSKLQRLKEIWNDRLIGSSQKQTNWIKLVYIRSLLFDKVEYFNFFYKYCQICIKQSKINKFQKMVSQLKRGIQQYELSNKDDQNNNKQKQSQLLTQKMQMLQILQIESNFVQGLIQKQQQIDKIEKFLDDHRDINRMKISQIYALCARTLYDQNEIVTEKALGLYEKAANLSKHSKDLNMLAIMNLKAAQRIQNSNTNVTEQQQKQANKLHQQFIFSSLKAQMQSLIYTESQSGHILQGFLKLLSLINNYGHRQSVYNHFIQEFKKIPIEGWIHVVPQMIAQLSYQKQGQQRNFIKILKQVLLYLGQHHPQSVLFSLNFAVKSKIPQRIKPAMEILQTIRKRHPQLTEQAENISSELGKAAIKLKQYWYDGIESAWATYNQSKSSKQVVQLLKQLCEDVFQRKHSNSEMAFHQQYGNEIKQGYSWLKRYQKYQDMASFSQAFQIFYSVYKKVKESFQNLKKVYLKNVSPSLVTTRHYKTTIPGLYQPGRENIRINGFGNQLAVLQSKQRPRKLTIYGDNGKEYNFLLKGRQDLRLDERVMQFLNLVNKLLVSERQTLRKDLTITKYSIIPLTLNTGLIGWVENCDTLNELIKQYRQMNKIRMYVEKQLYQKMCPQYAYLPMINKLQIFKNGLDSTQGKDLMKILWFKSQNCQSWVQRRTNYTTSLATMSIVGYILGLGDRHPSNIMIKRDSGKIVHIDFGDCFEVAVLREKFPQKVPFRLTRMLQKAMGVAGINGLYKSTCESVLRILRNNRESLLAVLETFAHDPIISWRITLDKNEENQNQGQNPFPEKEKKKDLMMGSIMGGLEKELNEEKVKQNQNVLIPKTVDMQTPIRRHHQPKKANKHNINEKASKALHRIKQKLKGRDFNENEVLSVEDQVSKLIEEAISHENICQSWPGWCPFW